MKDAPFLFGCATSAHQVEGGQRNDWTRFEDAGRTREPSGTACDSWNRWQDDIVCLRALEANAYRFSVEWSRLEPSDGAWDDDAASRYRAQLEALRAAGISPMVTLFHFTLPTWLADRGGALAPEGAQRFARFAVRVLREIGEPALWCTVNEPNVYAYFAYARGVFPPAERSTRRAFACMRALVGWHLAARRALKEAGARAPIGIAHHMRPMDPLRRWHPLDRIAARVAERAFHAPVEHALRDADFIGLNYYSRDFVAPGRVVTRGDERNDLGWEIDPRGLSRCLRALGRFHKAIYVTENGVCDAGGDRRASFIERHLDELLRARSDGVDVRGLYHWSLLDNFEWAEGYAPRFGLYSVERASGTYARREAPGADAFRAAARRVRADDVGFGQRR